MPKINGVAVATIFSAILGFGSGASILVAAPAPHIFQRPGLSRDTIVFGYAGDLWTVPRAGGRATRLTTGVGIETSPVFSPDGQTIAFTGEYDGNTDVFTVPVTGGIPFRVTYHPGEDEVVGWTPDSKQLLFRSSRQASDNRYTQLYTVPAHGGIAKVLPLPMAFQGQLSPDGTQIAYSPNPPGFEFDFNFYVAWGNYRGGLASTIWLTSLAGLDTVEIPHTSASDFDPVFAGGKIYFLSGRSGPVTICSYDPSTKTVREALHNNDADIRTLAGQGDTLVYDQLGEIHLFDTGTGKSALVPIEIDADLPEVRPRIQNVGSDVQDVTISTTGVRAAVEAHGEIFTVPVKHGPTRDITNTPGVMERWPAWSPDGQSIAYFSDESGLYALHVAPQTGDAVAGSAAVKKFPLSSDPAYYFDPKWSPDSKLIAFHDNRLKIYVIDTTNGKLSTVDDQNEFGGFSNISFNFAWSPDSKWLAYERSLPNHLHAIYLYSVDTGQSTQVTDSLADADYPAFDRDGKYLFFAVSTNAGAASNGLDMTSDLYLPTSKVYAAVLAAGEASPLAPQLDDEKPVKQEETKKDKPAGGENANASAKGTGAEGEAAKPAEQPKPVKIDLQGIGLRIVALPLPESGYTGLAAGLKGSLYFLEAPPSPLPGDGSGNLSRWTLEDRKTEKLAEHVQGFELSADGSKMLLAIVHSDPDAPGPSGPPSWAIVPADAPYKPGDGAISFGDLNARVEPAAEWAQMYHEVWRIERAYFYDPHFHGTDTIAAEKRLEPYVAAVASRADLNYIFQEMLGAFSVGHLRGYGGTIPQARRVSGGLLGADYEMKNGRYCLAKIYSGGDFNPSVKAPLAQPGLNVSAGDCIYAINGQELTSSVDIQQLLEGTAGQITSLRIGTADGKSLHDISVVPVQNEASLRNIDWIDNTRRTVDRLSGGKLAYVYLPDTGQDGFTSFNRYYFAQTDKQGAIIDERFNRGGQMADYFVEVLSRRIEAYWAPRYGAIEHTPNAGIYGPKVMIANEYSGSGGDALPWLFKSLQIGPLVGKRTWGGLVGIGPTPVLMDGGVVTAPSVAFFTPKGVWDVENHGVDPDYVVEQDPKAVSEGRDPQLEKAVALAMDALKQHPPTRPERPAYPNYHK